MRVLFKLFLGISGVIVLPEVSHAVDPVRQICFGGYINANTLRSLYQLGERLRKNEAVLNLPDNCMKVLHFENKASLFNPFVSAIELAAGKKTRQQFITELEQIKGDIDGLEPGDRLAIDEPLLRYLRIGCGNDLDCVREVIGSMSGFRPEKSPIFCDFVARPDPAVKAYFNSFGYVPMSVNCLYRSTNGGNRSIPAIEDWYAAYSRYVNVIESD